MKREYDFSHARRGPIVREPQGKTRITIRIDGDILDWFRKQVHASGGGSYQTMINAALREHMKRRDGALAETLRAVIREEIAPYIVKTKRRSGRKSRT
jgi:BrnA antitoxin of type II toxin-antitoxin system